MSVDDRDWHKEDRKRRDKLVWNGNSGALEFDRTQRGPRLRWPYRFRSGLPWWITEPLRIALFMLPFVLAYYAWKHFL